MHTRPGKLNLITDVAGITVGNAHSERFATGVTVVLAGEAATASVDIRGGAPGSRDTAALDPCCMLPGVHGIVLSGGSVFGLDAAGGVTSWLASRGIGLPFAGRIIPVVPAAILFDLSFGSDKDWGMEPPYRELGIAAASTAGHAFETGNAGAGYGATAGKLKGGLGSASACHDGFTVGALVAANPVGSCVDPRTGDLWARPFEMCGEFGDPPVPVPASAGESGGLAPLAGSKISSRAAGGNTTIAVVATDASLTKAECQRLAIMAADGMARAVRPLHTPFDGDTVFALATGSDKVQGVSPEVLAMLGSLAADCLARATARGVADAKSLHGWPAWKQP